MKISIGSISVAIVLIVVAAGCSREPDAKDSAVDADKIRSAVTVQVKDAAAALRGGDVTVGVVDGRFVGCGGGGLSTLQARYSAGADVSGGAGTVSERIVSAIRTLESAGWNIKDEGVTAQGFAYGRLSRGGLELSIDRDQLEGSQDFGFGVDGPCFDVTEEQFAELPSDELIAP